MTEIGEIPKEWEVKKLGDVVEVISGATPKTNINEYWDNGDIYWATPTDITSNGKYIYKTEKSITESGLKNCSAKLLPIGSILMSSRATIGERCINNVPMATNQGFKSLVCKSEVNNEFIYYYVDILKERLIGLASGSTFLEVSKKVVEDIKIAIPNLKEQEKIALILSTVDEQIDNVDALIEKNKELKKGLMQTLLTKGIGHTKFKKTEIGEIPEEWQNESLGDMVNFEGGTQPPKKYFSNECLDGMIRLIQIRDYKSDKFKVYVPKELCRRFCDKSDVMIGRYGPPIFQILRGLEGAYNVALIKATPINERLDREYLYYFLNNEKLFNLIDSLSQRTSGQTGIDMEVLKAYKIPIPPKKEQEKIVLTLSQIDKRIENYENRNKKLEELKKGLMQQLLTGKIRTI